MTWSKGYLKPSRAQIAYAASNADDSFCMVSDQEFMSNFPNSGNDWIFGTPTATLLRCKNVEPHDDPWLGDQGGDEKIGLPGWNEFGEPIERRAIFWLLKSSSPVIIGCGADYFQLEPGDFVVFDDTVKHWVMSDKKWVGAAVQICRREIV